MPMDAMIIPLNTRRPNSANAAPSFDPARHLAVEPPAWTVSLSDAAGDKPPSRALRGPLPASQRRRYCGGGAGVSQFPRPIWRGTRPLSTPSAP